jgi:RNA polymerase sigma factor (sigma-70 family)
METVKRRQHGKTYKGHTVPYGTLVGASYELKQAYYMHGYLRDEDMPELPCHPVYAEYVDPEEELFKKEMVSVVHEAFETLSPRAVKVLCLRFGIGLTQDYTLEEVGIRFDVTRERIRQIEAKAFRDLKHPQRSEKLRELIGYYKTTAQKEAEIKAEQERWERQHKERQEKAARAQEAHRAMKIADYAAKEKALADLEKWEDLKPMISDADWIQHLKIADPDMYQELKYMTGDIWGKSAREIWNMYAKEK